MDRLTTRWGRTAVPALIGLVGAAFLAELVLFVGVPVARDSQLFFLPQKRLVWEALQNGRLGLWSPFLETGAPLLANFQSGFFYPPNWLYGLLPLLPAYNILLLVHFLAGGLLAYAACRELDLPRPSAGIASVAFMIGGYFASLTNLINVLQAATWVPGILFALLVHHRRRDGWSFALLVGVLLLGGIAGEPITFGLGVGFAALFVAVKCGGSVRPGGRSVIVLVVGLAAAGVLAAGLAAVQIVPTTELIANSTRGEGLSFTEAARYSLQPWRLMEILVPPDFSDPQYRFGEKSRPAETPPWLLSIYLGAVAVALACHGFWKERARGEVLVCAVAAVFGVVLALGSATPVFGWFHGHVPGFDSFRFPERFYVLVGFPVALLAGYGARSAGRGNRSLRGLIGIVAAFVVIPASVALVWWLFPDIVREFVRTSFEEAPLLGHFEFARGVWISVGVRVSGILGATLLAVWAAYRQWVSREALIVVLALAVVVDLWTAHRHLTPTVDPTFYTDEPAILDILPEDELRTRFRVHTGPFDESVGAHYTVDGLPAGARDWMWQQTMQPNLPQFWGVQSHDAGDAVHLVRNVNKKRFLALLPDRDRWRVLRLGSVKYVYSLLGQDSAYYDERLPLHDLPGAVYTVPSPLPRAYVASRAWWHDDEIESFNRSIRSDFDPHREVALVRPEDEGAVGAAATSLGPTAGRSQGSAERPDPYATIQSDRGRTVEVALHDVTDPGYLVLTDTYYPGWTVTVDGEERPIHQANYFYRAVPVEPGDRQVVFRYRSDAFELGKKVSIATLLLLVVGLGGWRFREGRRPCGG